MEDLLRQTVEQQVPILRRGPDGLPQRGTQTVSTGVPGPNLAALADFFTAIGAGPEAGQRQSQNRLMNIQTDLERQRSLASEGSRVTADELRLIREAEREKRLGMTDLAQLFERTEQGGTVTGEGGQEFQIPGVQRRIEIQTEAEQRKLQSQMTMEQFRASLREPRSPTEIDLRIRAERGDQEAKRVLDGLVNDRVAREERAFARQVRLAELRRGDKPATQAELRIFNFYNRMADVVDFTKTFENEIFSKSTLAGQAWDLNAPNFMKSSAAQQYRQQQRAFTEARLRKESGAAIPESEFLNDARTYFAQPGDSPETIKRKQRSRTILLQSTFREAGRATEGLEPPQLESDEPTANIPPNVAAVLSNVGPGIHTLSDGSKWRKDEDGRVTRVE